MNFVMIAVVLLISIGFHEACHAFAAYRLGDSTAKMAGRLTLNPLRHLDLFGTLAILVIGFGWGKPVPVNARNFDRPRQDLAIVAAAGPLSNFFLAFLSAGILSLFVHFSPMILDIAGGFFGIFIAYMIKINAGLGIFNLIPIPPLDGGNLLVGIVPKKHAFHVEDFLETHGYVILIVLLATDLFFHIPLITGPVSFLAGKIGALFLLIFGIAS